MSRNSAKTVFCELIMPAGYLNEIYVYGYDNGITNEMGKMNGSTNTDEYFPKLAGFNVAKTNIKAAGDFAGYVYIVLRDMNRNGEIAGAVMYNVDGKGNLKDASVYNLP